MTDQALRRGRPTELQRLERRERMLQEALPVFLAHGYAHATVDDLARAAGVTKRTIYTDYGDKAGLFAAMVQELAGAISHDAAEDHDTLLSLATRIVFRIYSDEIVGLHRLVIAESARFPELAGMFYERADQRHVASLRVHLVREHGETAGELALGLFSLLLGEPHRRRLLGVAAAPTEEESEGLARAAIARLGLRLQTVLPPVG